MLKRLYNVACMAVGLAEIKGEIVAAVCARMLRALAAYTAAAALAFVALCGLLFAAFLALIPYMGQAGALAAVSGGALSLAAIVWMVTWLATRPEEAAESVETLRDRFDAKEMKLKEAFGAGDPKPNSNGSQAGDNGALPNGAASAGSNPSDLMSMFKTVDPKFIAAAGLAAAGLLGPVRLLRVIRIGAMLASTTAIVNRTMESARNNKPH
jgi:hypothetical protein